MKQLKKLKVDRAFNPVNLKPNEMAIFDNGTTVYKLYFGKKPECNTMPKPFPLKSGLTLREDKYGYYTFQGEMVVDAN